MDSCLRRNDGGLGVNDGGWAEGMVGVVGVLVEWVLVFVVLTDWGLVRMIDRPNKGALTDGIDVYRDAMRGFIVGRLRSAQGVKTEEAVKRAFNYDERARFESNLADNGGDIGVSIDVGNFSWIIGNQENWDSVFSSFFGHYTSTQNLLRSINDARIQMAHPGPGDVDRNDVHVALTQMANALGRINAGDERAAIEEIRDSLIPSAVAESGGGGQAAGGPVVSATVEVVDAEDVAKVVEEKKVRRVTVTGLRAWREVISPHPDILSGELSQAEFAADLQQVADGTARAKEYSDPVEFFRRTYLTPGIRTLLVNTLRRINGKSGDPVIQTKTGFGGGKTHSLIALYHLVTKSGELSEFTGNSGDRAAQELAEVFSEAGVEPGEVRDVRDAQVAVLIGTYISSTDDDVTSGGDPLNTLWGRMAYQLGGQEAYDLIGEASRQGTSPGGGQLDRLFEHVGPSVILIDELVAYVRNVPEEQVGSIYTFMQALSESVRRNPNVVLVLTLPVSEEEAGGDAGYEALGRLERVFGRIEAVHAPLETTEAFEVVRRRLFEDPKDPEALGETCERFAAMYRRTRREYPDHAAEPGYRERLEQCYPIHPEIFDRLYNDWSTIHRFQRTRGVLRLMALWIKRLYADQSPDPLILPANLPLSDSNLSEEFIKLLPGRWEPVVSEIDGVNSRTDRLDNEKERWLTVGGAAKRITRTIFLGSVPGKAIHGIDQDQIRLGVVQPTESTSVYNEARNEITGKLYYLHQPSSLYYFHTEENLNKVHADRVDGITNDVADRKIVEELGSALRGIGSSVIVCPGSSADVGDADRVRFVVLDPDKHLKTRASDSDTATDFMEGIVRNRGDAARIRRNTVVFITAKADEIRTLRNSIRSHLAWDSMLNGEDKLELSGARRSEVNANIRSARFQFETDLTRAYRWVVAPSQRDPNEAKYGLTASMTGASETGEILRSADAKLVADEKLVDEIAPSQLARYLKQYIWVNGNDHITVDSLWELFTNQVYLPRLRNKAVLQNAIQRGTVSGDFGYADRFADDDYENLRFKESIGSSATGTLMDGPGLVVEPEAAELHKEDQAAKAAAQDGAGQVPDDPSDGGVSGPVTGSSDDGTAVVDVGPSVIRVEKKLEGEISLDAVNDIQSEIVRNLTDDGGDVVVRILVSASKAGGFSQGTVRAVRENGVQLELEVEEG